MTSAMSGQDIPLASNFWAISVIALRIMCRSKGSEEGVFSNFLHSYMYPAWRSIQTLYGIPRCFSNLIARSSFMLRFPFMKAFK